MALSLTPINFAANDTPITLITLANTIVDVLATEVITVNTAANGGLTIGNGYVSGIFGASILVGGEVRGGTVQTSANLALSSNLVANTSQWITVGPTTVNSSSINVGSLTVNSAYINNFSLGQLTVGNTQIAAITYQASAAADQVFDFFGLSVYRTAEYLISITDHDSAAYQLSKILVVQDGTTAYVTEYGTITTGSTVATINATSNATSLIMTVTPITSTNATIEATRTAMRT